MKEILQINKKRLKNHWHYNKWYYLVGIIFIAFVINFTHIVTKPVIPKENKVNIVIYAGTAYEDVLNNWEKEMLDILPDDQREVNILSRSASGGAEAQMAMTARFLAGEDDVIIMTASSAADFAEQNAFLPLDKYMDIDMLTETYKKLDIEKYKIRLQESEDNEKHIYWLPLSFSDGFEEIGFPSDELVIGVIRNTKNAENAVKCLEFLVYK